MSKKSRKRNKKILAVLAAGLGAAALMKRRKLANATDTVNPVGGVDQMAADAASKAPVTNVVNPNAAKAAAAAAANKSSVYLSRMKGGNPDDPTGEIGQKIRANFAQKNRYVNPNEQTLAAGNAYVPRIPRVHKRMVRADGGSAYKKGGRVTGIAKRGFGRALMKGKK